MAKEQSGEPALGRVHVVQRGHLTSAGVATPITRTQKRPVGLLGLIHVGRTLQQQGESLGAWIVAAYEALYDAGSPGGADGASPARR